MNNLILICPLNGQYTTFNKLLFNAQSVTLNKKLVLSKSGRVLQPLAQPIL